MKRSSFAVLVAGLFALAIPASASATGSPESSDGGNCSSSGALVAANCTNISGPQVQAGGGLENTQQQNNNQQNGDNSGTSSANTDGVANSQPSNGYEGDSEPSGSGGNCSQHGALIAANCTNYSGGQYQGGAGLENEQQQNNNQQNGDNSGTSNANTNGVAGGNSQPNDNYDGNSEPSGSGGNCQQSFAAVAANCTNISKGQEQSSGGEIKATNFVEPGGSSGPQQQNNNQQNGDNSGTENTNSVVAGGHGPPNGSNSGSWSNNDTEHSSGGGRNCQQAFVILAANCTNISKGQWQSGGGGGGGGTIPFAPAPGGGSPGQQQNNNQQNGDNSGTENTNSVVAGGHGPRNGNGNSESWSNNDTEHSSGGGRNCTQSFVLLAANCTNYSGGQWQSGGGRQECVSVCEAFLPGGGSSSGPQQQNNNQQNGDNRGTENTNSTSSVVGHGPSENDGYRKSEPAHKDAGYDRAPSGGGRNCTQSFAFIAANCTNISKGQWQSNDGRNGDMQFAPGGGGSQGSPQQQNNNQQNGDNRGTENSNSVVESQRFRPRRPV